MPKPPKESVKGKRDTFAEHAAGLTVVDRVLLPDRVSQLMHQISLLENLLVLVLERDSSVVVAALAFCAVIGLVFLHWTIVHPFVHVAVGVFLVGS